MGQEVKPAMSLDADAEFAALFQERHATTDELCRVTDIADCPFCPACAAPTRLDARGVYCPDCRTSAQKKMAPAGGTRTEC